MRGCRVCWGHDLHSTRRREGILPDIEYKSCCSYLLVGVMLGCCTARRAVQWYLLIKAAVLRAVSVTVFTIGLQATVW